MDTLPHRFCAFFHLAFTWSHFSYKSLGVFRTGWEDFLCFPLSPGDRHACSHFHEKISYQGQLYHGAALSLNIYLLWSSLYRAPRNQYKASNLTEKYINDVG